LASSSIDATSAPLLETRLPGFTLWRRGKVRDVYDLGDRLLVVATDRISAFDVVLPTGIPGKGVLLTQLSLFWFRLLSDVVPNHVLTAEVDEYGEDLAAHRAQLEGRSMLVVKADPFPVECVVRGYLVGSGWKDYQKTGAVCGIALPPGLRESERLDPPLFTPSTKAEKGHDENISFAEVERLVGPPRAAELRDLSLEIYRRARAHAESRGIILADTKFEFGVRDGRVLWIDEALTPDSSRFWPADSYAPGRPQPSFDKQYVRDYLDTLGWDKRPPAPSLPEEVVRRTLEKYLEAHARLTGVGRPLFTGAGPAKVR
jgi:phosphoribosylaminoimidazole-succinocarboxamide synthase